MAKKKGDTIEPKTPVSFKLEQKHIQKIEDAGEDKEAINQAWHDIGHELGFNPDTVELGDEDDDGLNITARAVYHIPTPTVIKKARRAESRLRLPVYTCDCCGEERAGNVYPCDCANMPICPKRDCGKCELHCKCSGDRPEESVRPSDAARHAGWLRANIMRFLKMLQRHGQAKVVKCKDCGVQTYAYVVDKDKKLTTHLTPELIDHKYECTVRRQKDSKKKGAEDDS